MSWSCWVGSEIGRIGSDWVREMDPWTLPVANHHSYNTVNETRAVAVVISAKKPGGSVSFPVGSSAKLRAAKRFA